jgi:hypothetical protein
MASEFLEQIVLTVEVDRSSLKDLLAFIINWNSKDYLFKLLALIKSGNKRKRFLLAKMAEVSVFSKVNNEAFKMLRDQNVLFFNLKHKY